MVGLTDSIEAQLDEWREQAPGWRAPTTPQHLSLPGRGVHYAIAAKAPQAEGSLLRTRRGLSAGELKHGPMRWSATAFHCGDRHVDRALETRAALRKDLQLLEEMRAQGANVIAVANRDDHAVAALASECFFINPATEYLLPIARSSAAVLLVLHGNRARRRCRSSPQSLQGRHRNGSLIRLTCAGGRAVGAFHAARDPSRGGAGRRILEAQQLAASL